VQCTIFCWNPWTTSWIRSVWNRGAANCGTQCSSCRMEDSRIARQSIQLGTKWLQQKARKSCKKEKLDGHHQTRYKEHGQ